jgi:drug/metabolite transporter (DMT)-like permease
MSGSQAQVRHAIYLSLLMVFLASTASVATRYVSTRVSTEAIVTVQYLVCTLLCLPFTLRRGLANMATRRLGLHLFRGAAGVLGFYLFYAALEHVPMVDAVLLRQSAPLSVPLVIWLWNRERISREHWLPLLVGFVGVGVVLRPDPAGLSWWHAGGFISAICLAISMVATHKLATTEPASRILLYYFLLSLACVAPFGIGDLAGVHWHDWALMLYVGVSIYATLLLYTRAYAIAPAHAIAPINYVAVVLAAAWGWVLWGEVPDIASWLGSALVIAGGLLSIHLARDRRIPHHP